MPDQAQGLRILANAQTQDITAQHAAVVHVRPAARVIACCSYVPQVSSRETAIAMGQALVAEGQRVGVPRMRAPSSPEPIIDRTPLPCPVFDLARPEERRGGARRADRLFDILLFGCEGDAWHHVEALCAPEVLLVAGMEDVDIARAYTAIKTLDRNGAVAALRLMLCGTGDSAGVARRLAGAASRFLGLDIRYLGSISPIWTRPGEDRTELRRAARALLHLRGALRGAESFVEDCAERLGMPSGTAA